MAVKHDPKSLKRLQKEQASRICPNCHMGMLDQHPEGHKITHQGLLKCRTCGYTRSSKPA